VPFAGVTQTVPSGINNRGQIVGEYIDATGVHGFLANGGVFSPINVPVAGAFDTATSGINASGQIVGFNFDKSGFLHGFVDNGGIDGGKMWTRGDLWDGHGRRCIRAYSASGCFDGWASAKAGMAMQVL
jgi:uncharacterized membrane protein